MTLIYLDSVCREYRNDTNVVHALAEINLLLEAWEYISILGPSGSGKYTLNGANVSSLDVNQLATVRNREIGFVFQRFHLMPRYTAAENVALPLRFAVWKPKQRLKRAKQLLAKVGLADHMEHRPSELSGGQQQRVAIARALANQPKLILPMS